MEKTISRTVTIYTYPVSRIITDEIGTPHFEPLEAIVSVTALNAKRLRKIGAETYPGDQLFFGTAMVKEHTYTMPLNEFLENATLKEDK